MHCVKTQTRIELNIVRELERKSDPTLEELFPWERKSTGIEVTVSIGVYHLRLIYPRCIHLSTSVPSETYRCDDTLTTQQIITGNVWTHCLRGNYDRYWLSRHRCEIRRHPVQRRDQTLSVVFSIFHDSFNIILIYTLLSRPLSPIFVMSGVFRVWGSDTTPCRVWILVVLYVHGSSSSNRQPRDLVPLVQHL